MDIKTNIKKAVIQGILPVFIQFGILVLVIVEFYFCIGEHSGAPLIMESRFEGGEMTNPNIIRFVYMWIALIFSAFLGLLACLYTKKNNYRDDTKAFWAGTIGGTFMWQAIGECSWHFGVKCGDYWVYFPRIENASSTFILIAFFFLILYLITTKSLDWGMMCYYLSFMCNWVGHFCMIGTYPFVSEKFEEEVWLARQGEVFGGIVSLVFLVLIFLPKATHRQRLIWSLFLYTGIGIIATGVTGM